MHAADRQSCKGLKGSFARRLAESGAEVISLTLHPRMIRYMNSSSLSWLLLIVSLPTSSATARMRIWRALKALGCVALRDGAHLMPARPEHEQALQGLADECIGEGGSAWLMAVQARSES